MQMWRQSRCRCGGSPGADVAAASALRCSGTRRVSLYRAGGRSTSASPYWGYSRVYTQRVLIGTRSALTGLSMGARTDGMKTPLGIDMPYVRHEIDHTHCSGDDRSIDRSMPTERMPRARRDQARAARGRLAGARGAGRAHCEVDGDAAERVREARVKEYLDQPRHWRVQHRRERVALQPLSCATAPRHASAHQRSGLLSESAQSCARRCHN